MPSLLKVLELLDPTEREALLVRIGLTRTMEEYLDVLADAMKVKPLTVNKKEAT